MAVKYCTESLHNYTNKAEKKEDVGLVGYKELALWFVS